LRIHSKVTGRLLLSSAVAAIVVALSACGSTASSSTSSASSATPAASSSVADPSGKAIVVGMICSCTGPEASAVGNNMDVIQAWAKSVNASGGINGYPVKVIALDDQQNAATTLQDAKELVEQDHVVAIVGDSSFVDASFAPYVESAGVPVIGGSNYEASFLSNPDFFPSGGDQISGLVGQFALAKQDGKKVFGTIYCAESPICAQLVPVANGLAPLYGLKSYTAKISATAPSYTAPCLAAKSAGVDAMFVADNSPIVLRFVAACAQQGYTPQQVSSTQTATSAWLSDSTLNGAQLTALNANGYDTSTPAIATFQAALKKYAPSAINGSAFSGEEINPWSGGLLFQAAAKAAHLTPSSTPADVKKGLYALKNETLDGVAPPLNFTPGKPSFIPCWFAQEVKDGKFASLNGDRPSCLTAAQAAALAKALKL
jgi:branched-chain amino acid transport system substrate-binding protein